MDLSDTLAPKSDQLDYEDLIAGDRVFTIREVRKGPSKEQPVEIVVDEFPRPWRPPLTVRRLMAKAWGADSRAYIGRRVQLWGDPDVRWGGKPVGGIRIRALSDITEPLTVTLMTTRGKRDPFVIQPLDTPQKATEPDGDQIPDDVVGDWTATLAAAESMDELQTMWADARKQGVAADPRVIAAKDARKQELTEEADQ